MTSRERWTVYPLLFMTLGIALTGRYKLTTKEVVCEKLICSNVQCMGVLVTDAQGHEQVAIFSDAGGGQVRAKQLTSNRVVADKQVCHDLQCRTILITDVQGHEQVAIFGNDAGGQVRLQGNLTKIRTLLGSTDRLTGLLMVDEQGASRSTAVLWRFLRDRPLRKHPPKSRSPNQRPTRHRQKSRRRSRRSELSLVPFGHEEPCYRASFRRHSPGSPRCAGARSDRADHSAVRDTSPDYGRRDKGPRIPG